MNIHVHNRNSWHGSWGWTATLIPTIYLSAERDYANIKYGLGKEPDAKVLVFHISWLFWGVAFKVIF